MAARKMMLQPKVEVPGVVGFLLWARRDNRPLYEKLVAEFPEVAFLEERLVAEQEAGLAGFTDVLKSIGSGAVNIAKSAGTALYSGASSVFSGLKSASTGIFNFAKNNALPIAATVAPVIVAKQQADVTNKQLELAAANQVPAQTAVTYDSAGNRIVVPVQSAMGNVFGSAQRLPASYYDTGTPRWLLPAALGLGAFVLVTLFAGRK